MKKNTTSQHKTSCQKSKDELSSHNEGDAPIEIIVCVGSSCHIKGSRLLIKQLSKLINDYKLEDRVLLKGSFCLEHCAEGFNWKIGDEFFSSKDVKEAEKIFRKRIIEPLRGKK